MSSSKVFFIEGSRAGSWIGALLERYSVFSPVESGADGCGKPDFSHKKLSSAEEFAFNPYRPVEPLKSFFTPCIERVADYFGDEQPGEIQKPSVVFGLKACDLAAHEVQDYVFLKGVEEDPFYRVKRDNIVMVSGDCPDFKDVCFCLAMGGKPYPESGFDLNLSPAGDGGFLAEAGSPKGENLLEAGRDLFSEADESLLAGREAARAKVVERLKASLEPMGLPDRGGLRELVVKGMDKGVWAEFALTCVECGGCNFICDTCHCFLLSDKKTDGSNRKLRLWDSCQYKNFAAVAGGGNPMRTRGERLRNRFLKKFDFFVENMGKPACCGCGRCIEVCPGEIDIREVLKAL